MKNFVKLDSSAEILNDYYILLNKIDKYIRKYNNLDNAIYWSICQDNNKHNEIFCKNNVGKKIETPWKNVIQEFPQLMDYQSELGLHAYVGCTLAGNWGIHKHCYDNESYWNIAFFKSGCTNGSLEFFKEKTNSTKDYTLSLEELDYGDPKLRLTNCLELNNGDIVSLNTMIWHAHITKQKNVRVYLNCIIDKVYAKKLHRKFKL